MDPRFTNRERQPGLDLLRALAIVIVVIYHAGIMGFALPGEVHRFGWIGVDLFFVLSGYLIGGQLLAPIARGEGIKLGRFFARRALRILPPYLVVIALAPSVRKWASDDRVRAFVGGVTAAAAGAIGGAAFVLGRRAIIDVPTAIIGVVALLILTKTKRIPEPVLILVAAVVGLVLHR